MKIVARKMTPEECEASKPARERLARIKRREELAAPTCPKREKRNDRKRIKNMTEEQVERQRARQRVESLTPNQHARRLRSRSDYDWSSKGYLARLDRELRRLEQELESRFAAAGLDPAPFTV